MYYKKKNTNLKLVILIVLITLVVLIGFTLLTINVIKNKKNKELETGQEQLAEPEITITNLNEKDKDVESVKLKIEAKINDPNGIDYVRDDKKNKMYYEIPFEINVEENGIYTFTAVAKNTKTKSAKIEVKQIKEKSAKDPYIPNGFKKKENTKFEDGFVIEDKSGNEYVWVPVPSGKLPPLEPLEAQDYRDEEAGLFNNSVSKNYGFYIARYEAGVNEDRANYQIPVSKPKAQVWNKVTHKQARTMSQSVAKANGYDSTTYTSLISGGAWRAVLEWCNTAEQDYSKSTKYGNYWDGIQLAGSGNDVIKNIYNLAGNVKEWTDELYLRDTRTEEEKEKGIENLPNRILRGGSGDMFPFTPEFRTFATNDTVDEYWGFRFILYVDKPSINGQEKKEEKDEQKENQEDKKEKNEENKENKEEKNNKDKKENELKFN